MVLQSKKVHAQYFTKRSEWREWLAANFDTAKEVWLIYPHISSGRKKLLYNDAVEEALCFGWIDSTVHKFDAESSAQRFTPRRSYKQVSQPNRERLAWLLKEGLIHPSIEKIAREICAEPFVFPTDIITALEADPLVWQNFQRFSPAYQRIRVAYINEGRNRLDEFTKRLHNFMLKTKNNRQIGFGGIEKYY